MERRLGRSAGCCDAAVVFSIGAAKIQSANGFKLDAPVLGRVN